MEEAQSNKEIELILDVFFAVYLIGSAWMKYRSVIYRVLHVIIIRSNRVIRGRRCNKLWER